MEAGVRSQTFKALLYFLHFWQIFKSRFQPLGVSGISFFFLFSNATFASINNRNCAKLQSCRVGTLNYKSSAQAPRFLPDIYAPASPWRGPAEVCTSAASFLLPSGEAVRCHSVIVAPRRTENRRQIAHHNTQAAFIPLLRVSSGNQINKRGRRRARPRMFRPINSGNHQIKKNARP